ncbi:MAG: fimbrillin family protein [Bacteroidaceae bacterium]|nr:fimbrillin family protein [Bacteroidaceae bacterium]
MMKKIKLLSAVAFASLAFVGCSESDLAPAREESVLTEISLAGGPASLYTDVSVRNKSGMRRATIHGDNDEIVETIPNLGVFCLAREVQGSNPAPTQIGDIQNWFQNTFADPNADMDDPAVTNNMFCLIHNLKSTRTTREVAAKSGKAYEITWDKDTVAYYPTTLFYSYDFFAYYPYSDNLRHVKNARGQNHKVEAALKIDGHTDVLWGRATVTDEMTEWEKKYAYSAKYFREQDSISITTNPVVKLEHVLTRMRFLVTPGATVEGGSDIREAKDMTVEKIAVRNVNSKHWLTVADLDNLDITADKLLSDPSEPVDMVLWDEVKDTVAVQKCPQELNDTVAIGDGIMLPPAKEYMIQIILSRPVQKTIQVQDYYDDALEQWVMKDEVVWDKELWVSETPLMMGNGGKIFAQGKSYDVVITVHGPKQIGLGASLKEWETEQGPTFEL